MGHPPLFGAIPYESLAIQILAFIGGIVRNIEDVPFRSVLYNLWNAINFN